jgi:NitT/TauT family transport system ATP-binding protein
MTYRAGTIKRHMRIDLPRPRDPNCPAFNAIRKELGLLVIQEQQRFSNDERGSAAPD